MHFSEKHYMETKLLLVYKKTPQGTFKVGTQQFNPTISAQCKTQNRGCKSSCLIILTDLPLI